MISILLLPFLLAVALVWVHVSFGAFVLRRGVLFIDLALAQWAALGYLVGQYWGLESSVLLYGLAFGFTVLIAAVLSGLKSVYPKVSEQEGVIGAVYIAGACLALTLISVTGMEAYHLDEMLSGHFLFVDGHEVAWSVLVYGVAVLALYLLRHVFLAASSKRWDFLFYVLFGLVVTSSVKLVGVLLVFSYLVLPVLTVLPYTSVLGSQVKWGWFVGLMASVLGMGASFYFDVAPSYCVILSLCLFWVGSLFSRFFYKNP